MLQQILEEMYIDPEILAELSEEQVQVLYYKMREEQVRRYNIWSREERPPPRPARKKNKKVGFQTGRDGDVWVWVMGEHREDKPYERLVEEARHQEATRIAEEELRAQREEQEALYREQKREEEEKQRKLREEEERLARIKEELSLKWQRAEAAALHASRQEAKRLARQEEEKIERQRQEAERKERELKAKEDALKRERERRAQEQREKRRQLERQASERSEDIYMSASQVMSDQVRLAQEEREKVEQIWQVQLRKIKLADKQRAKLAMRARDEVRKSRISQDFDGLKLEELLAKSAKNSTQPTKPKSRSEVIAWYKRDQLPKGAGMVKGTRRPEAWFHGCINRTQAAVLLDKGRSGSFLIRLSEKVWGYALSYKDDQRVKHFLIDATDSYYRFFGADQITHKSLTELVKVHKERPITHTGQEILREACGQSSNPPDYKELLE